MKVSILQYYTLPRGSLIFSPQSHYTTVLQKTLTKTEQMCDGNKVLGGQPKILLNTFLPYQPTTGSCGCSPESLLSSFFLVSITTAAKNKKREKDFLPHFSIFLHTRHFTHIIRKGRFARSLLARS